MNLYFGNIISTISTLLVIGIFIYMGTTIINKNEIKFWGKRLVILVLGGLLVCIFVAIRDRYHLSVQASMDANILPGLFTIGSIQSTICCIGGAVIAFCSISSIFVRKQSYWRIMFFILSITITVKMLVIELSRLLI